MQWPTEDITIVLFPERHKGDDTDDNNFIAVGRSHYDQQDIDSFSEEEDAKSEKGSWEPAPGCLGRVYSRIEIFEPISCDAKRYVPDNRQWLPRRRLRNVLPQLWPQTQPFQLQSAENE